MARDAWYEIATKLTASAVEETKLGSRKAEVNICFARLQNFCQKIFVTKNIGARNLKSGP